MNQVNNNELIWKATIAVLVIAMLPLGPVFYSLIRIVVFSCACYYAYKLFQKSYDSKALVFVIFAVIYNPFFHMYLYSKGLWIIIDIIAIIFIYKNKDKITNKPSSQNKTSSQKKYKTNNDQKTSAYTDDLKNKKDTNINQKTYTFSDGSKYVGEVKDEKFHGQGTNTYDDGETYTGGFKENKMHGHGKYIFANGNEYEGEFKDNIKNGKGIFYWTNGNKYEGEYKDDKRNGHGTFILSSGSRYIGEWKDDNEHGDGTYTYHNGDEYVGKFKEGKVHGKGTMTFVIGAKYEGEFIDDKRNGNGTFTLVDGRQYIGEFIDDKRNGYGTNTFPNKDRYKGKWKDDEMHGEGIYFYADGTVWQGEWKDGEWIKGKKYKLGEFIVDNKTNNFDGNKKDWNNFDQKTKDFLIKACIKITKDIENKDINNTDKAEAMALTLLKISTRVTHGTIIKKNIPSLTKKQIGWAFGLCDALMEKAQLNQAESLALIHNCFRKVFGSKVGIQYVGVAFHNNEVLYDYIKEGGQASYDFVDNAKIPVMPKY